MQRRKEFKGCFGSVEHARVHCVDFFRWYNTEHHHSGLGYLTPYDVHHDLATQRTAAGTAVLARAHAQRRERFPRGTPRPLGLPKEVWINRLATIRMAEEAAH